MGIEVLGVSGSPIPNSNTDRAVQRILEWTGLKIHFVKLSDLELAPCRACLGCVKTGTAAPRVGFGTDNGRGVTFGNESS